MGCEDIRSHLSAYVDGLLDPQIRSHMEKHLSTCKICRQSLESLQRMVQELSDLEEAKAPEDFLEQIHLRMTKGSDLHALMRRIFPLRVKIPYPFAAAIAMAVLIFVIIHTPQIKQEIYDLNAPDDFHESGGFTDPLKMPGLSEKKGPVDPAPDISKARQLSDQAVKKPLAGSDHTIRLKQTRPEAEEKPAVSEVTERVLLREKADIKAKTEYTEDKVTKVVEFYLTLKTDIFSEEYRIQPDLDGVIISAPEQDRTNAVSHSAGRTAPTVKSLTLERNRLSKYHRETGPSERAEERSEKSFFTDDAFSNLRHIIDSLNGEVLSTKYDQNTGQPIFFDAVIPSDQYGFFHDKLHELGTPQSPLPEIDTNEFKRIHILIHLIGS